MGSHVCEWLEERIAGVRGKGSLHSENFKVGNVTGLRLLTRWIRHSRLSGPIREIWGPYCMAQQSENIGTL